MICREEQDDTLKYLRLIPVDEVKLTAAKMMITFAVCELLYLLLFLIAFGAEAVLHFSGLSAGTIFSGHYQGNGMVSVAILLICGFLAATLLFGA